jgi:14-3-3 protein epsilon
MSSRVEGEGREEIIYLAKLAEQAERFDDMKYYMKQIAEMVGEEHQLTVEERNYLSVAYKNVVGTRRAAWRVLNTPETHQMAEKESMEQDLEAYHDSVEAELTTLCDDVLNLIEKKLIPSSINREDCVFYEKMAGDYFRYKAEFMKGDARNESVISSKKFYENANLHAGGKPKPDDYVAMQFDAPTDEHPTGQPDLKSTNPIRLGLILNYSVFLYEIENQPSMACNVAKEGFDAAVEELDQLPENDYKDATLIMQLLRDNLALWTSEEEREGYEP